MDREKIEQAMADAHDEAMELGGVTEDTASVLCEAAAEYLRVTEGMPVLADGSVLAYSARHVYRNGEELGIDWPNEVAYDDHKLSECWPTREQSLKGKP